MPIEVSIIMPSHNRYPLNLLTLYSLERQTYDASRFEVILVDDASTDLTPSIVDTHQFPFALRYIRLDQPVGRPRARNIGIRAANGTHLIFLDAEIMVEPDFVAAHMRLHAQHPHLIVGGLFAVHNVYTTIDPQLSPQQKAEAMDLLAKQPKLYQHWQRTMHESEPLLLFSRNDVWDGRHKTMVAGPTSYTQYMAQEILDQHGDDMQGFHLPWLITGTGNLSVSRAAVEQHGGFEEYDGWGADDLEFGYRLFLRGFHFTHITHPPTYHQAHPVEATNSQEGKHNFYEFQQNYREISLLVLLLGYIPGPLRISEINHVLSDVYRVAKQEYPRGRFVHLVSTLRSMLEAVGYLHRFDLPIGNLVAHSGIIDPSPEKDLLLSELQALGESGSYPYLYYAMHRLMFL